MCLEEEGVWNVSGRSLEGVWKVSGRCLEGVWKVSGRCLEDVLKVFEYCLEHIFRVSWKYKNFPFIEEDFGMFQFPLSTDILLSDLTLNLQI